MSARLTISRRWAFGSSQGRGFTDQDKAGAPPVVIVNETIARKHWPNGRRDRQTHSLLRSTGKSAVDGGRRRDEGRQARTEHCQSRPNTTCRTRRMYGVRWCWSRRRRPIPASLAGALRQQVWAIDKDQPVFDVRTMEEVRSISVALYSFSSVMLGDLCGRGVVACVGWNLRRDGVRRDAAHAGDWNSHGARRTRARRFEAGGQTRDEARAVRNRDRIGWVVGAHSFHEGLLFGVEPTDLLTFSVVSVCLAGGRVYRVLPAGAPRDEGRSARGAEIRIKVLPIEVAVNGNKNWQLAIGNWK